jgi:hypothetical protein
LQIEDALIDLIAEDFIRDVVIESELEEELPEIAKSVLTHYDTKVLRRELKEVRVDDFNSLVCSFKDPFPTLGVCGQMVKVVGLKLLASSYPARDFGFFHVRLVSCTCILNVSCSTHVSVSA